MGEKTTIEIDNIRDLKQHALDTNKTLKQLINEAIIEKIQRERTQFNKGAKPPQKNHIEISEKKNTDNKIEELMKTLSNAGLLTIVEKECSRHDLQLKNLSSETITPQLMSDIHTAITLVFDDETAEQIIQKIESFLV